MEKELILRAYWQHKPYAAKELAGRVKNYLHLLQSISPVFDNLLVLKKGVDKIWIDKDYSNFKELFYKGIDDDDLVFTNVDSKGFITDDSVGWFTISISNRRRHTDDVFSIDFDIHSDYGYNTTGIYRSYIQFNFPENNPAFFELEFCRNLLKQTAMCWKAEYAYIYPFEFYRKVKSGKTDLGTVGWLNYFNNNAVKELLYDKNLESIMSFNGLPGCMATLTAHMPDANNEADVKKALAVRDAIEPKGFLNWQANPTLV